MILLLIIFKISDLIRFIFKILLRLRQINNLRFAMDVSNNWKYNQLHYCFGNRLKHWISENCISENHINRRIFTGAHAVGRCHTDRSGFWGPWTHAESTLSNEYYRLMFEEKWTPKKTHNGQEWKGPPQFENKEGDLMMLSTGMNKFTVRRESGTYNFMLHLNLDLELCL